MGEVTIARDDGLRLIIELAGEHDIATVDEIRRVCREGMESTRSLVLDLSDTTFMDASVLAVIDELQREARQRRLRLAIVVPFHARAVVRRLLIELAPRLGVAPLMVVPTCAAAERLTHPPVRPSDIDVAALERQISDLREKLWVRARETAALHNRIAESRMARRPAS